MPFLFTLVQQTALVYLSFGDKTKREDQKIGVQITIIISLLIKRSKVACNADIHFRICIIAFDKLALIAVKLYNFLHYLFYLTVLFRQQSQGFSFE